MLINFLIYPFMIVALIIALIFSVGFNIYLINLIDRMEEEYNINKQ